MPLTIFPDDVMRELAATRYMCAAGLIVLLYDHLLTLGDEIRYIWPAPATYAKYIFLLNRYTVLATLLAVAYETCGFVHTTFTDLGCKQFIFTCSMLAIVSVGIANLLILQRVVILWEHRPIVLKIMTVGFLISFTAQVATMIATLIEALPFIRWSGLAGMCIATKSSPILIAVWASPMLFEVFVLGSTALNALDRPRTVSLPMIAALHSDGLGFFMSITCFRILNLTLAAISRPSLVFLAVFFIWAMTTTILGRLLLHLRRTECRPLDPSSPEFNPALVDDAYVDEDEDGDGGAELGRSSSSSAYRRSRAISPFGLVPLTKRVSGAGSEDGREARLDVHRERRSDDGVLVLGLERGRGAVREGGDADAGWARGHGRGLSSADGGEVVEVPAAVYEYHYQKRSYDPYVRPWD